MPDSTVTVRASGSRAMTLSIGFRERNCSELLAMLLKQCRVPRTLNFFCFLTKSCTCCRESAVVSCSVPYSRLPAQFLSLLLCDQASSEESAGLVSAAEQSLRNVLLSMRVSEPPGPNEYSSSFRFFARSGWTNCTRENKGRQNWRPSEFSLLALSYGETPAGGCGAAPAVVAAAASFRIR